MKNHRFGGKFATFRAEISRFLKFWSTLREKVAKSGSFREKAWKISIWQNTQRFEESIRFRGFDLFGKKCKSGSFREKAWKIIHLARTCKFLANYHASRFDCWKKLQKVAHFVKKHEKSSIRPKLATFRENYQVSSFRRTFRKNLQKVDHFVKSMKNSRFAQHILETITFRHFHQLLGKSSKTGSIEKGRKISIWPKLLTFRANYHVLRFWRTLRKKLQKVAHLMEKHEE